MAKKRVRRPMSVTEVLESMASAPITELLQLKASISDVNNVIITRLETRLTELVAVLAHQPVTVLWEDVSLMPDGTVAITGLRLFAVGDIIEYEGAMVEITSENVDVLGLKIRIVVSTDTILRIADPDYSIPDLIEELSTRPLDRPKTRGKRKSAHPLDGDPLQQWIYAQYNASSTKH